MQSPQHQAILVSLQYNTSTFIPSILQGTAKAPFEQYRSLKGVLFGNAVLQYWLAEEDKHGNIPLTQTYQRPLKQLSSGERKKALLQYLLSTQPDFIIVENLFDNMDAAAQKELLPLMQQIAQHTLLLQIATRKADILPFIPAVFTKNDQHEWVAYNEYLSMPTIPNKVLQLPPPLHEYSLPSKNLVRMKNVTIHYEDRCILQNINWTIEAGDFWQLTGPNGSGKTTLLTLITGDNAKAYGQELFLFERKKGTGETVWDIKEKIGYLTPAMTDLFNTRHTLLQMIVSGFFDAIGLYVQPTDIQLRLAQEWLQLIQLQPLAKEVFGKLTTGEQRLALIARAMVKHPPLLILDEPTAGLDDVNAALVVALINKIAKESSTAIIYVSHRLEEGLQPQAYFQLTAHPNGSTGAVIKNVQAI